jgi:hypothetical protein
LTNETEEVKSTGGLLSVVKRLEDVLGGVELLGSNS